MPEEIKLHMRRVDDLLKEYASLSEGKLRIENLDPSPTPTPRTPPTSTASAASASTTRTSTSDSPFPASTANQRHPFLDPRDETMLEYHLSKAIAEVSTPVKPKIGIMSALDLKGGPPMMPGQPPKPPWVIYQQLKQSFDLVDIPMETPRSIPRIKVLLLFHPAGITPEAEFAIDQYLLNGGTVVACLDAFSVAAQMTGGGNPMMGMGGAPTTSTLPTLLKGWGVTLRVRQGAGRPRLRHPLAGDRIGLAVLTLPRGHAAEGQRDHQGPRKRDLLPARGLHPHRRRRRGRQHLIKSTTGAGFVDSMRPPNSTPRSPPPSARAARPTIWSPISAAPSRPPSPMANPARKTSCRRQGRRGEEGGKKE
jgi:hypothetical protein